MKLSASNCRWACWPRILPFQRHWNWHGPMDAASRSPAHRPEFGAMAARAAHHSDTSAALMLGDLIVEGSGGPRDEHVIAEAVAAHDPLVALTVAAACPTGGRAPDVAVDIEGFALRHFAGRQQAMLRDVHRLAERYGWTECQIMDLPASRRASYLALIDGVPYKQLFR
jgi:hypothetical protein